MGTFFPRLFCCLITSLEGRTSYYDKHYVGLLLDVFRPSGLGQAATTALERLVKRSHFMWISICICKNKHVPSLFFAQLLQNMADAA